MGTGVGVTTGAMVGVGAGVAVRFNINGIFYTRKTDENGTAALDINLPPRTYVITAEYNGLRASNTITVKSVLSTSDLTMRYLDGSQFKAKLLDGQGRPYPNQNITFNINGRLYKKLTNDEGIAALDIRLLPGEYIITSSFNGLNAANKVTITG